VTERNVHKVAYDAVLLETVMFRGAGGEMTEGYLGRPLDSKLYPSVIVMHHGPGGYDPESMDVVKRIATNGYICLLPNMNYHGAPGAHHDDAAAAVRAAGGLSNEQVIGDGRGAIDFVLSQPNSNGRVGMLGFCIGGTRAFLIACHAKLDAVIDAWGGAAPDAAPGDPPTEQDVAFEKKGAPWPIDYAADLSAPLLGLYGKDDPSPSIHANHRLADRLAELGKSFDYVEYDGAGHAFMNYERSGYRLEASVDAWKQIWDFFGAHLQGGE
jgi:carboxymethylenebutenolidase